MVSSAASCVRASRRASGLEAARRGLSWLHSRRCSAAGESGDVVREGGSRIPAYRRARLARRAFRAGCPGDCLRRLWHGNRRFVEGRDEL
ncbi:hypothetical protein BSLA_02f0168 [Burkholderia stabilis]|nr:hypothetical protein BSLA_02f0168 [Burkholderia stabilis]